MYMYIYIYVYINIYVYIYMHICIHRNEPRNISWLGVDAQCVRFE